MERLVAHAPALLSVLYARPDVATGDWRWPVVWPDGDVADERAQGAVFGVERALSALVWQYVSIGSSVVVFFFIDAEKRTPPQPFEATVLRVKGAAHNRSFLLRFSDGEKDQWWSMWYKDMWLKDVGCGIRRFRL